MHLAWFEYGTFKKKKEKQITYTFKLQYNVKNHMLNVNVNIQMILYPVLE